MMKHLFDGDVTRDISAVVYFHDDKPERLKQEVSEYIITGGFPKGDPRHERVPHGIHECYVRLMREIARQLDGRPALPAAWISGFYGSGKSSFAKLLGLALDGRTLPDGTLLADAWLARDRSPGARELRDAWQALTSGIRPMAVVFDIGGEARDNEHVHITALRQIRKRLGYSKDGLVADGELRLEEADEFKDLARLSDQHLSRPWTVAKNDLFPEDSFSMLMHKLHPEVYPDPDSWAANHEGKAPNTLSTAEATRLIQQMLEHRAPDATLFLVVDEISQYIHQDDRRMLKLQSFVSDLGQRLEGRVWLLVTGQEQLDATNVGQTLGKMKDRFPPSLRVHLSPSNIRDVVHQRLLAKKPEAEATLKALFETHRSDLKLFALECEHITASDFVEVYPLLPGHVDLLLEVTQALRNRASRSQGDDHAIRSLLQLLGELFRTLKLAEAEVGRLITLDDIFAIQATALPGGTQKTLARIREHCARETDPLALRAARAVSLLQLISESRPTTVELIAKSLYEHVARGNNVDDVRDALERLHKAGLLTYSDKRGYKLQSSSGQEWSAERDGYRVTPDAVGHLVQERLRDTLLPRVDVPRHRGAPFKVEAWFSDGRQADDVSLKQHRNEATFTVDLRFIAYDAEQHGQWVRLSSEQRMEHRLLWVVGPTTEVHELARSVARSRYMVNRYDPQRSSLSDDKLELLNLEQTRLRGLEDRLTAQVEGAFSQGALFFRGEPLTLHDLGSTFPSVLHAAGTRLLPSIYPHFDATNITQTELDQLLDKQVLSGVSPKFLSDGLGLLSLDAGRYVPTCDGSVPTRMLQFIEESGGTAGSTFFAHFARPPYGYAASLLRACILGLLRAKRIHIRTEKAKKVITSHNDPGARELFRGDRALRNSEFLVARTGDVTMRDRVAMRRFFKDALGVDVEADSDALADAVFTEFPTLNQQLRQLDGRLRSLPGTLPVPEELERLGAALADCQRSRHIDDTVKALKSNLDALRDGVQRLRIDAQTLTEQAVIEVNRLHNLMAHHVAQLDAAGVLDDDLRALAQPLREHLASHRPWVGIDAFEHVGEAVVAAYLVARQAVVQGQVAREEAARERLKAREGFDTLTGEQQHSLLRPLAEPSQAIDPHAIQPTLRATDAQAQLDLQAAEAEANRLLDKLLHPDTPTVSIRTGLSHRQIGSVDELDALLDTLRERVRGALAAGNKVRLQ
jgi:hypothetical protein